MGITAMKINNFGYLLKEGIRGIFLHGFMSFAAVCVTVACLLIVGSFYALTYNVSVMVEEMDTTNEILVFADLELSDAEAKSIRTQLRKIENIKVEKIVKDTFSINLILLPWFFNVFLDKEIPFNSLKYFLAKFFSSPLNPISLITLSKLLTFFTLYPFFCS